MKKTETLTEAEILKLSWSMLKKRGLVLLIVEPGQTPPLGLKDERGIRRPMTYFGRTDSFTKVQELYRQAEMAVDKYQLQVANHIEKAQEATLYKAESDKKLQDEAEAKRLEYELESASTKELIDLLEKEEAVVTKIDSKA